MKKIFVVLITVIIVIALLYYAQGDTDNYNSCYQLSEKEIATKADSSIKTNFVWKDSQGDEFPV